MITLSQEIELLEKKLLAAVRCGAEKGEADG